MVRKIIASCLLLVCLLVASPMQALADDSIYTDGNISSTYTSIFEDVLNRVTIIDDYVYFRSGQYEYTLIVGDLDLNNNVFTSSKVKRYTIITSTQSYNQSIYRYSVIEDTNFRLNASDYLVYSNLGNYPTLIERGVIYEYATLVLLCIVGLCLLIRPIFKFTYHLRNGSN